MGLPTQSSLAAGPRGLSLGRRGLALPSAMFALVAVSVLLAGLFVFADLSAKSIRNRERANRAVHVAEAGVAHTLGLMRGSLRMHSFSRILRGSDNLPLTPDDSVLTGWGLSAGDQIPLTGQTYQGHTYFVSVTDDPADGDLFPMTDLNGRVLVRCRSVTNEGASAEVAAIIAAVPFPAMAADGNVNFSGSPTITGQCGGAHANGNLSAGGTTVLQTQATATGTTSGDFNLPDGSNAPMLNGQPQVVIPDLVPLQHCVGADYRLRADGFVVPAATGIPENATGTEKYGWKRSSGPPTVQWNLKDDQEVPGTFCIEGNAVIGGNVGALGAPIRMSIIATGSIEVSGNPFMAADHDDGIMFLAGGDMSISGNPGVGTDNFSGLIYAGAQCKFSGNPSLFGQIMCANGAQPAGSVNHTSSHDMSGNWTLNFDCSANVFNKRRVLFWYPRIGA